jgi:hypothetical protein
MVLLKAHINTLATAMDVPHCALYHLHRLYAHTREWADLDPRDLLMVSAYIRSLPRAKARDIPVFLSHSVLGEGGGKAGATAYRLVTVRLLSGLELVMITGSEPTLTTALQICRRLTSQQLLGEIRTSLQHASRHVPGPTHTHTHTHTHIHAHAHTHAHKHTHTNIHTHRLPHLSPGCGGLFTGPPGPPCARLLLPLATPERCLVRSHTRTACTP